MGPELVATVLVMAVWGYILSPYWWRVSHTCHKCGAAIILLVTLSVSFNVLAQEKKASPMAAFGPMGMFVGQLLGPELLRNHPFEIVVRMGADEVVRVKRVTDADGRYHIKNVLPMPALAYYIETVIDGVPFHSDAMQLPPKVKKQEIDVTLIKGELPRAAPSGKVPVADPSSPRAAQPRQSASHDWNPQQWMSFLLSVFVVGGMVVQLVRKRKHIVSS